MNRTGLFFAAALIALPLPAFAHPHIFVEARLEIVADAQGNISELRNVWRFDEMFSASVLLDFDKNTDLTIDQAEADDVGKVVMDSLSEYSYYTFVTADGKPVKVAKPDVIHVAFKDNQILMFFSLKPETATPLKGRMTFGVWDPTMYTAVDFSSDDEIVTQGDAFSACKRAVVRPDPDEVLAQNQSTLTDAFFNDPSGTDMSKMFATRLEITC